MAGNREPVAVARIRDHAGQLVGSGFLIAPDLVLTCTHVVRAAGGDGTVDLDFPLRDGAARAQAHVLSSAPDNGDATLLRLTAAPPAALRPARVRPTETRQDEPVRILGYATRRPTGPGDVIVGAVVAERSGLLQVNTEGDLLVETGYSGSPVYRPDTGAVVGMVVTAVTGRRTCNAIPIGVLLENFPEIGEPDETGASPYRGLEPFEERHAAWFKGREELAAQLARRVRDRPLLIVMGSSGSGKSSLVRAGLVPALRSAGARIVTARLRPGEKVETLVARLVMPVLNAEADVRGLAERLRTEREDALPGLAGELDDQAGDRGLLLFVDQLEEAPPEAVHDALVLLDGLVRTARRRPDGTARVAAVVTLRAGMLEETISSEIAGVVGRAAIELVPPMSRNELRAAVRAGDVGFEDGLDERILADAGSEPGRLPLIEFTLELLWQRRRRFDTLTVAAYEELGGVSGALATYADQVLERRSDVDQGRIRAVLTAMARPSHDGTGFRRRPLELAGLGEPERAVVDELAARRLVVVAKPDGRAEYAEPAHQALLESWPTLAGWLAEDRDFLVWRDQLRTDRERWVAAGNDPDALLRGAALSTAQHWVGERRADLSEADLGFVRAGQERERRRLRVLRAVVAVVSILALVAGLLAVVVARRNAALTAQARVAASRQFAAHSLRFRDSDPAKALQFAQAAWHTKDTPEAYGALLTQYALLDPVDKIHQGLWKGVADQIRISDDGQVAVITGPDKPVAWTGLPGNHPRRVELRGADSVDKLEVDPSGRYVAGADDGGTVAVWDLDRPDTPRVLANASATDGLDPLYVHSIAFSRDSARLLVFRAVRGSTTTPAPEPDLRVWDVAGGTPVTAAVPLDELPRAVQFGPQAGTVVVARSNGVVVQDLASGRTHRSLAGQGLVVAEHGASVLDCATKTLRVRETATGAVRRQNPRTACEKVEVEGTTTMAVLDEDSFRDDTNVTLTVVDPRTGTKFRGVLPRIKTRTGEPAALVIGRSTDDVPFLLALQGDTLYHSALRLARPERSMEDAARKAGWVVTPDGRFALTFRNSGRIEVSDAVTGSLAFQVQGPPLSWQFNSGERGHEFAVTRDSRHLLVTEPGALAAYALPNLTLAWRQPLPEPDLGTLVAGSASDMFTSVAVTGPGRATILHHGILTSWSISTGRQDGPPLPLTDQSVKARYNAGYAAITDVHPDNRNQVAVVWVNGRVQIWDLVKRKAVFDQDVGAVAFRGSAIFNRQGERLAVVTTTMTEVWDLDSESRRPLPAGGVTSEVLGFTPKGYLVMASSDGAVQVWDVDAGLMLAHVTGPDNDHPWTLGETLAHHSPAGDRVIPIDPATMFQRLCELSARDFIKEERALLRDGAPADPPCS